MALGREGENHGLESSAWFWANAPGGAGIPVRMGSYDLTIGRSINTTIKDCRQTTDIEDQAYWGLMASNFCKGITLDNCIFSRFDAHQGVMDVTLKNSIFGHMATRAVGSGTFIIDRCEVRAQEFFSLRDDYGSTWDGEIIIRDCVLKVPDGKRARIIGGANNGDHDFGYPCMLPRKVTIEGMFIDDSKIGSPDYRGPALFSSFRQAENAQFSPTIEGEIIIRDLTVSSGKPLRISDNPSAFAGYTMTVE